MLPYWLKSYTMFYFIKTALQEPHPYYNRDLIFKCDPSLHILYVAHIVCIVMLQQPRCIAQMVGLPLCKGHTCVQTGQYSILNFR